MNKKECLICGNTNAAELEKTELFSDGDGNEAIQIDWLCKEEKGCNK